MRTQADLHPNFQQGRRNRAARPILEGLEDRMLLYSVTGDHFTYGSRITWSIMPDGTNIAGVSSNLVATLNQRLGSNWIGVVNDSFAQWESITNVNFARVADSGAPLASGSYQQGSPDFGDIRIGGFAQGSNVLAFTLYPPPTNGSSSSGDVVFNSNQQWNIGSNYDLQTVLMHEVGHALGMGHSTDPTAVMYAYYGGVDSRLNSDDVAGVRSIWGPRAEDPVEVNTGNTVSSRAADITGFITPSNNQAFMPGLDVANQGEAYWFKITTPSNSTSTFTAQVQSLGLSEFSPRVVIFNASLQGLVQTIANATDYGTTIQATINNATPNTTYYVKVLGSNNGSTGTGAYALTLNMGSGSIPIAYPPNTVVAAKLDLGGGYETLTVGGDGSLFKALALGVDWVSKLAVEDISSPTTIAALNLLRREISMDSPPLDLIQSQLIGLLQAVPDNSLDFLLARWGIDENGSHSPHKLQMILANYFAEMKAR